MRNLCILLFTISLCIVWHAGVMTTAAGATVPELINYQGRLTNALGSPVDTTVSVTFAIYDDSLEGEILWTETKTSVEIVDGLFNVILGTDSPISAGLFTSPSRYLGITVGADAEMVPRTRFVSTPYTHRSVSSDTAGFAFAIADNSVTSSKLAADAVTSEKIAAAAVTSEEIEEGAVTSLKIEDGSIQFVDISSENVEPGQIIKWDGSEWSAAEDEIGISGGWVDDGDVVRLESVIDSVGIGTALPKDRLDVEGGVNVSGNLTLSGRAGVGVAPNDSAKVYIQSSGDGAVPLMIAKDDIGPGVWIHHKGDGEAIGVVNEAGGVAMWLVQMGDSPAFVVDSDTAGGVPALLIVENDGHVGIGTNAPSEALEVAGVVYSTSGGVRFPDGTLQSSAAGVTGWEDDGTVVRLQTATDSVGIGIATPSERLDVDGNIRSSGTITSGHSITIDGVNDRITAAGGTISFDDDNLSTAGKASIGPGHSNTGTNAFVAGESNMITGQASAIGGGRWNVVDGNFSAISGGFGDTIASTADYGYLFGIGSKLTEDSTFMVDMPHIRFGDEDDGYEFPLADGDEGQVMTTDGDGVLSWNNPPGAVWNDQGTWIKLIDPSDNVNIGGTLYPSEKLQVTGDLRVTTKANIGLNTTNAGNYAFVAGEESNASGNHSAVSGGFDNSASGAKSVIGGGHGNSAGGSQSTVAGGAYNTATGGYSTVAGGRNNCAIGDYAFAAGKNSKANHAGAVVISANLSVFDSDSVRSGGFEQMVLRADGGLYITNVNELAPYYTTRPINTVTGAYLTTGGTWVNAPPKSFGDDSRPVDGAEIVEKLAQLSIARWSHETEDAREDHISPASEQFNALFGVGDGGDGISAVDAAGVALVAIQELHKKTQEIDELKAQVMELQRMVDQLAAGER